MPSKLKEVFSEGEVKLIESLIGMIDHIEEISYLIKAKIISDDYTKYNVICFHNYEPESLFPYHLKVGYILSTGNDNEVLFSGYNMGVPYSPKDDILIEQLELIEALLFFLCLGEDDTDEEHFNDYTESQILWRDTKAESLGMVSTLIEEYIRGENTELISDSFLEDLKVFSYGKEIEQTIK